MSQPPNTQSTFWASPSLVSTNASISFVNSRVWIRHKFHGQRGATVNHMHTKWDCVANQQAQVDTLGDDSVLTPSLYIHNTYIFKQASSLWPEIRELKASRVYADLAVAQWDKAGATKVFPLLGSMGVLLANGVKLNTVGGSDKFIYNEIKVKWLLIPLNTQDIDCRTANCGCGWCVRQCPCGLTHGWFRTLVAAWRIPPWL